MIITKYSLVKFEIVEKKCKLLVYQIKKNMAIVNSF